MDLRQISSLAGLLLCSSLSFADTAKEAPKDPCCGVKINGYINGSYNHLQSSPQFISGIDDRDYDIEVNGFTLHEISWTTAYQPETGFGGLVDIVFGRDAKKLAPFGYDPDIGHRDIGFTPLQVFVQYATPSFTFLLGNVNSLTGYEATDPTSNPNFSNSFLSTFTQPNTVFGVRGTYAYNDKLKLILGVNDGWNNIRDFHRGKTIEWGIIYNPSDKFSLTADGYIGQERVNFPTATGPKGMRDLIDIFFTYALTEKITLACNFDYGSQANAVFANGDTGTANWYGIAGYFNYKFNDKWRYSIRGEVFNDKDGYTTGVDQTLEELTFTLAYAPVKNLEFRGEARRDFSNRFSYVDVHSLNLRKTQQSFGIEAVYAFNNSNT